jgi:flagellar biosynthesis protein FlhF
MNIKKYIGKNAKEAMAKAQEEYGDNALLVNTVKLDDGTVEVTMSVDENDRRTPKEEPKLTSTSTAKDPAAVFAEFSKDIKELESLANIPSKNNNSINQVPVERKVRPTTMNPRNLIDDVVRSSASSSPGSSRDIEDLKSIKGEISKLTDKVKIMQNIVWDEKSVNRNSLSIPPEFAEIYRLTKKSGMDQKHLESILKLTLEHMPQKMKENSTTVKRYFQTILRKMIPVRSESQLYAGKKKIMMFVGPTGVGKTTTIAKIAARYSFLLEKKYKVGVITLDTYRIGATEHLMSYAKMMKLTLETANDPTEFMEAIDSLRGCDYILVDTAGSSQYDKNKINKLVEFIRADEDLEIDVNLVVSSTTKLDDLKDIYENFSVLDIDSIIFTKLDEAREFGNIFSLLYDVGKPLTYFAIGQDVPYDFSIAKSEYLIDYMLDGFSVPEEIELLKRRGR